MGIIRTYTRHERTPETHCTPPWVRHVSRFAHTFELFVTAWCIAGYVVSGEVAVQVGCCIDVPSTGTIPTPYSLQTRNPSLMTSHCNVSHRITHHVMARCITRTHEFFTRVLPTVKSRMELVPQKFGSKEVVSQSLHHRFDSRAESNFKLHLR